MWKGLRNQNELSLRSQAVHRVGAGGAGGLDADGRHSDDQRGKAGPDKYPGADADAVSESLQPLMHEIISDGGGDEDSNTHQPSEIFRKQLYDAADAGAHYFADA